MADTFYTVEYPIDFKVNGDDTTTAVGKNIQELDAVYEKLNQLREDTAGELNLLLTNGTAITPGSDTFHMVYREDIVNVEKAVPAVGDAPGLVRYADIVTEESLYAYLKDAIVGTPVGGILMWAHGAAAIPPGFAVCDGADGTPDLRGLFVKGYGGGEALGTLGGAETVTLPKSTVLQHTHELTIDTTIPGHSHELELIASSHSGTHTHVTGNYYFSVPYAGEHTHADNGNTPSSVSQRAGMGGQMNPAEYGDEPNGRGEILSNSWSHNHPSSRSMVVSSGGQNHQHPFTGTTSSSEQDVLALAGNTSEIGVARDIVITNVPPYREIIYIQKKG
jgi:hypothetical protein